MSSLCNQLIFILSSTQNELCSAVPYQLTPVGEIPKMVNLLVVTGESSGVDPTNCVVNKHWWRCLSLLTVTWHVQEWNPASLSLVCTGVSWEWCDSVDSDARGLRVAETLPLEQALMGADAANPGSTLWVAKIRAPLLQFAQHNWERNHTVKTCIFLSSLPHCPTPLLWKNPAFKQKRYETPVPSLNYNVRHVIIWAKNRCLRLGFSSTHCPGHRIKLLGWRGHTAYIREEGSMCLKLRELRSE